MTMLENLSSYKQKPTQTKAFYKTIHQTLHKNKNTQFALMTALFYDKSLLTKSYAGASWSSTSCVTTRLHDELWMVEGYSYMDLPSPLPFTTRHVDELWHNLCHFTWHRHNPLTKQSIPFSLSLSLSQSLSFFSSLGFCFFFLTPILHRLSVTVPWAPMLHGHGHGHGHGHDTDTDTGIRQFLKNKDTTRRGHGG